MPRLRDVRTGVVVEVDDSTAASLPATYEPAQETIHEAKKVPAKKAAPKPPKK